PNSVPGTEPKVLLEWARRAEQGPYSSLGVVDRIRYDNYEPLTVLAGAAGVTTRIGLCTMVVIGPLRAPALLAKEAATVDALSGGRLTLGVGIGARTDDYRAAGVPQECRGDRLSQQLAELRAYFEDGVVGPRAAQPNGPPLLVGGTSDTAFARMARYADGYVHGGGPPRAFASAAAKARTAWVESGRPGTPRLWAQGYFALGDDEVFDAGRAYMRDYYAFAGPFAERIAEGLLTTPQDVVAFVRGYAEAGCEELVLLPATNDISQVNRLAEVVAG
ncbi:MAG: LLM class flavin-dependent oxidoreductase, partial [Actinomycetota bacterium]